MNKQLVTLIEWLEIFKGRHGAGIGALAIGRTCMVKCIVQYLLLGVFDMTGELMRFCITSMATNGKIPSSNRASFKKAKTDDNSNANLVLKAEMAHA